MSNIILKLAIIILPIAIILYSEKKADIGICDEDYDFPSSELKLPEYNGSQYFQGECFFSDNYTQALKLFVKSAKEAKGTIVALPVTSELNTHVAVLEGNGKDFLIHMSGTHGPEGFAGSAVQSAALQYIAVNNLYDQETNKENMPTILFVHALNPYGFMHNRRVNEENIDLNRNFLTPEQFKEFMNRDPNYSGYVDLDYLLNPSSKPFPFIILNEIHSLLLTLVAVFKYGTHTIKTAMVAGNYHKPTGYGFGGFKLSKSADNLINFVKDMNIPQNAERVVLIDVHTGLGPSGVDSLLFSQGPTYPSHEVMEQVFPTERNEAGSIIGSIKSFIKPESGKNNHHGHQNQPNSHKAAASTEPGMASLGYELTNGFTTKDFCSTFLAPHLSGEDKICVTQEFGTVDMILVGKYGIDENYAHHHGSENEKLYYGEKHKGTFYVNTKKWKRSVARRGMQLFLQGLAHASSKHN